MAMLSAKTGGAGLVGEGKTNQEIGVILSISPRTVPTHLEHVCAKLGVVSRAQAVAEALRRGGGDATA